MSNQPASIRSVLGIIAGIIPVVLIAVASAPSLTARHIDPQSPAYRVFWLVCLFALGVGTGLGIGVVATRHLDSAHSQTGKIPAVAGLIVNTLIFLLLLTATLLTG